MKAIHALATSPSANHYCRRSETSYDQEDFEILTTIMSTLTWRTHNGSIRLFTDKGGHEFYERLDLLDLWDAGVGVTLLEATSPHINCNVFWSFGKLVALRSEMAPCCVLDADMIVWRDIRPLIRRPVMTLHRESLLFPAYVGREQLTSPPGFDWRGLDWSAVPCSAAFLVFLDDGLRQAYAERALSFMIDNPIQAESGGSVPLHPIFAEQRLLAMCAKARNVDIGEFLRDVFGHELHDGTKNTHFTHLWNAKSRLFNNPAESRSLCRKYASRISLDYPGTAARLAKMKRFRPYFQAMIDAPSS